jgi:hypothetical protein
VAEDGGDIASEATGGDSGSSSSADADRLLGFSAHPGHGALPRPASPRILARRRVRLSGKERIRAFDATGQSAGATPADPFSGRSESTVAAGGLAAYDRSAAFNYAWSHWDDKPKFGDDCQNFTSWVVQAGGWWQFTYDDEWDPYNYGWINVFDFENFVYQFYQPVRYLEYVSNLQQGDVLHLHYPDGSGHSMVVVSNNNGNPLLAAHTHARWNYPFTSVEADSPGASYYAMHIYADNHV